MFEGDLVNQGRILADLLTTFKNLNSGVHSNVFEQIWIKFGMIKTSELYILILA